jgi:diacylglycerol kinase family enzyme
MNYYVLYNPMAGKGQCEEVAKSLESKLDGSVDGYADMTKITNYSAFLSDKKDCAIVVCGGDGTLNRFINATADCELDNEIYYCAVGTGNDFLRDIGKMDTDEPILVDEYIRGLPTVTINGEEYSFINAVGYGIDGYCCEVGDKEKLKGKKPNYASIAIFGLLFHYKPCDATVIVDGEEYNFKRVWISPVMHGRYYGGGMFVTPDQDRFDPDGKVSFATLHNSGALYTLMIFPSIFQGKHVEHTKQFEVRTGHEITVEFDRPTALQIDGETVLGVTSYTVKTGKTANKKECAAVEV